MHFVRQFSKLLLVLLFLWTQAIHAQESAVQVGSILQANYAATPSSRPSDATALGLINSGNTLRLDEATISITGDWNRIGFRLDGGLGDFYGIAMNGDALKGANQHLEQAYAFGKIVAGSVPIQWQAGKFFSSVGAETPRSYQNFNESRSLLFYYGSPLYHVGVRASAQISLNIVIGAQLLNGSNTVTGAHGHQTMALSAAWNGKHWGVSELYFGGREKTVGRGWRQLSDTVLTFNPTAKITGYFEMLAAVERRATSGFDSWYGGAAAAKFSPLKKWSFSPRAEWFNDATGATTGQPQQICEATLTGEYRARPWMVARLEYREEWSTAPFYSPDGSEGLSHRSHWVIAGITFLYHPPKAN